MHRLCAFGALFIVVGCHYDARGLCTDDECVAACASGICDRSTLQPATFASPRDGCAPVTDAAGGSQTYPFCDVASAVAAAETRGLAYVYADGASKDAPFIVTGTLTVSSDLTIDGSRTRSAGWTHGGDTASIALTAGADDSHVEVSAGASLTLNAIAVTRTGACSADCATIHADGADVTLTQAVIGRMDATLIAEHYEHAAVWLEGASRFVSAGSTIYGCASCATSTGIKHTGAVPISSAAGIDLTTTTIINHGALVAYGLRTESVEKVQVKGGLIDVAASGFRAANSFAYGIADGDAERLSGGACIAPCGASTTLTLAGSVVKVDASAIAVGVSAAATKTVTMDNVTVSVLAGEKAIGVATYGVAGGFITSGATAVTATTSPTSAGGFARGYADNYGFHPALSTLGSHGVVIGEDTTITAAMTGGALPVLQAIALAVTSEPEIRGNAQVTTAAEYATAAAQMITGIALETTSKARIEHAHISLGTVQSPVSASTTVAGITDGRVNVATKKVDSSPEGSAQLEVTGAAITINATHADTVAGIILAGSSLPKIRDAGSGAVPMALNVEAANYIVGVQTMRCASPIIDGLHVIAARTKGSAVPFAVTGTLDGSVMVADATQFSDSPMISRTIVETSFPTTLAAGFSLHGGSSGVIVGNIAWHKATGYAIGAFLVSAGADVRLNTFRFDGCAACGTQNHAVGIYSMVGDGKTVNAIANDMIVVAAATPKTSIMLLDQPASSGSALAYGTTDANNYGILGSGMSFFARVPSSNRIPVTFESAVQYDNASFKAAYPAPAHVVLEQNTERTRAYCTRDPLHLDVSPVISTTYGSAGLADIDGDTRDPNGDTTGADVFTRPCP